jgi:hypothetical protein
MPKWTYIKKKRYPLHADESEIHGKGIYASKPIKKGTVFIGTDKITPTKSRGYNWSANPNVKIRQHCGEDCVEFLRDVKQHEELTTKPYKDNKQRVREAIDRELKTRGYWEKLDGRTGKVTRHYRRPRR